MPGSVPYKQFSASGNLCPVGCDLLGIFVSSCSGTPTITIYDDASTGTTTKLVDTFTPIAGTWYPLPFRANKGLNLQLGGTVSGSIGFA